MDDFHVFYSFERKMPKPDLSKYRWPKVHTWTLEECEALTVAKVLADLPRAARREKSEWRTPRYPNVMAEARIEGAVRRWWLVCPECGSRRGALYRPPGAKEEERVCRGCLGGSGAVYASQRFPKKASRPTDFNAQEIHHYGS